MEAFQVFLLLSPLVSTVFACDGYSVDNLNIEDCGDPLLQDISKVKIKLTSDCKLEPSGNVRILQNIKDCSASYILHKKSMPPITLKGKDGLCSSLKNSKENPMVTKVLNALNIYQCPVNEATVDTSKAVFDMTKDKDKLGLVKGDNNGEIKGTCTVADSSGTESTVNICYKMSFTIKRASSSKTKMFG